MQHGYFIFADLMSSDHQLWLKVDVNLSLNQLASYAVDHLFPEWESWPQFLVQSSAPALLVDGLSNSHPVEVCYIITLIIK